MKKYNYPSCVLCDTTYIAEYSDYVEHCEGNDIEPQDENSNDYWDFVAEMQQMEWEDLFENLSFSSKNNDDCIIIGSVGLWYGKREVKPMLFHSVTDAIKKCASNCDNVKVELKNGHVEVNAYHHDGTNCFEIHKLSPKGLKVANNHILDTFKGGYLLDIDVKDYWLGKWTDYIY